MDVDACPARAPLVAVIVVMAVFLVFTFYLAVSLATRLTAAEGELKRSRLLPPVAYGASAVPTTGIPPPLIDDAGTPGPLDVQPFLFRAMRPRMNLTRVAAALQKSKGDELFSWVSRTHGARPWGRLLDAGTGRHSLAWVLGLETAAWTAVTGDVKRQWDLEREFRPRMRPCDRVVTGNWADEAFLGDATFDVVLADYLLGSIDGFAPYFQSRLFHRLRRHCVGVMYIIGLEPYAPDTASAPPDDDGAVERRWADDGAALLFEIIRVRDAAILLGRGRTYREYPASWIRSALTEAGWEVTATHTVPLFYGRDFAHSQLDVAERYLGGVNDGVGLRSTLASHVRRLRTAANAMATVQFGEHHLLACRPASASRPADAPERMR